MANPGKDFEDDFRDAAKQENLLVQRFYDVVGGRKAQSYPCDFFAYLHPRIYFFELKSTQTGTIPIKNISKNQYDGLLKLDKHEGVISGLVVKYTKYDEHFFIPITEIKRLKHSSKKSIMYKDIKKGNIETVPLTGILKRTRYGYKVRAFLKLLAETYKVD